MEVPVIVRILCWTGLGAAVIAAFFMGFIYLYPYYHLFQDYGPSLGPRVHGWEVVFAGLYCGLPGLALFILGWGAALWRKSHQDPAFLQLYAKTTLGLVLFGLLVLAVDRTLPAIGQAVYQRQEKDTARLKAVLDDPSQFSAWIDSAKDLNAPLGPGLRTPLEEAILRDNPDLVQKAVEKGATVTEEALQVSIRSNNTPLTLYLWDHSKGLTGLDALTDAFCFAQVETFRQLAGHGVKTDPFLARMCGHELLTAFKVGQADWEVLFPPGLKGKGLSGEMFRFAADKAGDKKGPDARGLLKIVVFSRDVQVLKMLLESGFDLHVLDGQLNPSPLLTQDPEVAQILQAQGNNPLEFGTVIAQAPLLANQPAEKAMVAYLNQKGLRWR